jgi:hypothetical protein
VSPDPQHRQDGSAESGRAEGFERYRDVLIPMILGTLWNDDFVPPFRTTLRGNPGLQSPEARESWILYFTLSGEIEFIDWLLKALEDELDKRVLAFVDVGATMAELAQTLGLNSRQAAAERVSQGRRRRDGQPPFLHRGFFDHPPKWLRRVAPRDKK